MKEQIQLQPLNVNGFCRIELRDARTGELLETQEGPNFISPQVLNVMLKQAQKLLIGESCPNGSLSVLPSNPVYDGLFRYLVLMDSTVAESPSTEYKLPTGTVIGWANRLPYAGGSTVEGTINMAECWNNENTIHWVFDFPTNAANGSISSVCWAFNYPETKGVSYLNAGKIVSSNFQWLARLPRIYSTSPTWGDGYFWAATTTTLYKIDPVTFQEIGTYTFSALPTGNRGPGFVVRNGYAYFNNPSGYPVKQNISTGVSVVSTRQAYLGGVLIPIMVDDTYVYFAGSGTSTQYMRYGVSDLVYVDTKTCISGTYGVPVYSGFIHQGQAYIFTAASQGAGYGLFTINLATGVCSATPVNDFYQDQLMFSDGTTVYTSYQENYFYSSGSSAPSNTLLATISDPTKIKYFNLMARKLLATPVVKTSSKTMKIIYEFTFA